MTVWSNQEMTYQLSKIFMVSFINQFTGIVYWDNQYLGGLLRVYYIIAHLKLLGEVKLSLLFVIVKKQNTVDMVS